MAAPEFPGGGGANPQPANLLFRQNFPKTAWKWKKLDQEERDTRPWHPLNSPMQKPQHEKNLNSTLISAHKPEGESEISLYFDLNWLFLDLSRFRFQILLVWVGSRDAIIWGRQNTLFLFRV